MGSSIEEITSCANVDSLHIAKVQSQTLLSRELAEGRARLLLSSCTDVGGIVARAERVRLTSCSGRGATGFLRGMPTSYMSQLENVVFRTALQIFLGTIVTCIAHAPAECNCWRLNNPDPVPSSLAFLRGVFKTRPGIIFVFSLIIFHSLSPDSGLRQCAWPGRQSDAGGLDLLCLPSPLPHGEALDNARLLQFRGGVPRAVLAAVRPAIATVAV